MQAIILYMGIGTFAMGYIILDNIASLSLKKELSFVSSNVVFLANKPALCTPLLYFSHLFRTFVLSKSKEDHEQGIDIIFARKNRAIDAPKPYRKSLSL